MGNITDAAKAEMFRLREENGLTYGQISRKLGISVSAISWHCLKEGVEHPTRRKICRTHPGAVVARGNHTVRNFTAAEDDRIQQLDKLGIGATEIGRQLYPRRAANSVRGRLMTLARREARAEEAIGG